MTTYAQHTLATWLAQTCPQSIVHHPDLIIMVSNVTEVSTTQLAGV